MLTRCEWCGNDPLYIKYHDKEWGVPLQSYSQIWCIADSVAP